MNKTARILLAVLVVTSFAACKKKEVVKPETEAQQTQQNETTTTGHGAEGRFTEADLESNPCLRQRVVYFDFDRADVRPEAAATLACHGKYLKDRPSARMTLEGHADERGTEEYNLALGQRRAEAVKKVMTVLGVQDGRIETVSFGEEKPAAMGHDEGSWAKNRRADIKYAGE